jgi:hypothetical protein
MEIDSGLEAKGTFENQSKDDAWKRRFSRRKRKTFTSPVS